MGPSGGGKSSLLAVLGGRSTARVSGTIAFNGRTMDKQVKRKLGYVMQVGGRGRGGGQGREREERTGASHLRWVRLVAVGRLHYKHGWGGTRCNKLGCCADGTRGWDLGRGEEAFDRRMVSCGGEADDRSGTWRRAKGQGRLGPGEKAEGLMLAPTQLGTALSSITFAFA